MRGTAEEWSGLRELEGPASATRRCTADLPARAVLILRTRRVWRVAKAGQAIAIDFRREHHVEICVEVC
jgi:hypothetical protein